MKRQNLTYNEISFIILGIGFSFLPCCKPDYEPPTAGININPKSGDAPLSVNVEGYGIPGTEEIKAYTLHVDNWKKAKSTPFDTTLIFNNEGSHNIYMEVTDTKNKSDETYPSLITVYPEPYIEQTAALEREIEIDYSATLSKIANAELKIKKNGNDFLSQQITDNSPTGADYTKTFKFSPDNITKGIYEFALKSGNLEKKTSVEVPNYKPTADLSGIDANLMEETEKTVTLQSERFKDKNPEDINVPINSVKSLDGKTQATLNGNDLKIKALPGYVGDYQVEINFGSTGGGLEKAILTGNIIDDTRWVINPFIPTNTKGAAFGLLTTKDQRDAYVLGKLYEDWVDTMQYSPNPLWDCTEFTQQLLINFHGFPGTGACEDFCVNE